MKLLFAFLRLIRWPNLVFIALTQFLFEYCIYERVFPTNELVRASFYLLMIASVLIAAAGYIINDYFDLNIDQINRPGKVVVSEVINRRWVIFWHMSLSLLGIYFTIFALPFHHFWHLVLANMLSVIFLWIYSTSLKKQLLVGNLLISFLTAWVIGILYFSKYPLNEINQMYTTSMQNVRFFRLAILYAGFAFIISFKTMPIVWGVNPSKVFVAVWLVVIIASLLILQAYTFQLGWWASVVYCLFLIVFPLVYVLIKLYAASQSAHYNHLSTVIKFIMFTGILSMIFFRMYH
ncbi:MAG: geranylgeranylglycerol-phosphate geranylgeranyltransferase [Bacteroidetes bacterium]|nr:geranylgeranylglycerol-phosphate geranylgeranyltransferase [Bacteroidota bacterium]